MPWGSAEDTSSEWTTTADAYDGFNGNDGSGGGYRLASKHDDFSGNGDAGTDGFSCHNCGEPGHMSKECDKPKQKTGECFNCGQVGHNKAECPNPKVDRPFTGNCRVCNEEGHRAADCPTKPAEVCRNCGKEGHKAAECDQARTLDFSNIPEMSEGEAMKMLADAASSRDTDKFKIGVKVLVKGDPTLTYTNIETKIRAAGLDLYLVALERETPKTFTYVDLQGKSDRKFSVAYVFNPKPRRMRGKSEYPTNTAENMERLSNAGEPMRQLKPVCLRCGELGHMSKQCSEPPMQPAEDDLGGLICNNCGSAGHYSRDCKGPRVDKAACRNCGQPGHKSSECPEPRSASGVECRVCSETGHFARDCPQKGEGGGGSGGGACRNCGEEGHFAKDCEKPRNPATMTCRNCDEVGHMSRECPKPRDYSRVKCKQCGEMGHTVVRCPGMKSDTGDTGHDGGDGGFDNAGGFAEAPSSTAGAWDVDDGAKSASGW